MILVTGAAGFIGSHLIKKLLEEGNEVIGVDNYSNYYDPTLKKARIASLPKKNFKFLEIDIEDKYSLNKSLKGFKFNSIVNLAAQPGVRYSLENPDIYISTNVMGFHNIINFASKFEDVLFIYASSSSVYGLNKDLPFKTSDRVDNPASLYAATKKSNELIAHVYSHLYNLDTVGLRFFTVYGPWGRPDMSPWLFTEAMMTKQPIKIFNHGDMERDFTYVDDIINGIFQILVNGKSVIQRKSLDIPYLLYNIGNDKPEKLIDFIEILENKLEIKAEKVMMDMQPGDVIKTWASMDSLNKDFNFKTNVNLDEGLHNWVEWFKWWSER